MKAITLSGIPPTLARVRGCGIPPTLARGRGCGILPPWLGGGAMVSLPPWRRGGAVVSLPPWLGGGAVVSGKENLLFVRGVQGLMSIVQNVHLGVQLYTWVGSGKRFCRSVTEGT